MKDLPKEGGWARGGHTADAHTAVSGLGVFLSRGTGGTA